MPRVPILFSFGDFEKKIFLYLLVVDIVNHLVRLPTYDNNKHHTFLLKRVCCILIRTFVEDNNSTARGLAREVCFHIMAAWFAI